MGRISETLLSIDPCTYEYVRVRGLIRVDFRVTGSVGVRMRVQSNWTKNFSATSEHYDKEHKRVCEYKLCMRPAAVDNALSTTAAAARVAKRAKLLLDEFVEDDDAAEAKEFVEPILGRATTSESCSGSDFVAAVTAAAAAAAAVATDG